jgi:Outer membrane protein beta-barrel domain
MRKLMLLPLCTFFIICYVPRAAGQTTGPADEYPRVEFFAGFSVAGYNPDRVTSVNNQRVSSFFSDQAGGPNGFDTSVSKNFTRHVGLKGDFAAYFNHSNGRGSFTNCSPGNVCVTGTQDFKVNSRTFYFLAGPEFKWRNRTRVTPYAHALFGGVHSRSEFSTTGATLTLTDNDAQTGFAMAFGGGLDVRVSRRASIRTLIDYAPTYLREGGTNERSRQDHIRLSLGILFH